MSALGQWWTFFGSFAMSVSTPKADTRSALRQKRHGPFLGLRTSLRLMFDQTTCWGSHMASSIVRSSRRKFLQYLATSPLVASGALEACGLETPSKLPDPMIWTPADFGLIKSPKDAINVFDFEPVARKNVPPAHFGYMASGIDDEITLRAHREGFLQLHLPPRPLVDVSKVDTSTEILGVKYASPIVLAPIGGQRSFHDEGEVASARAAKVGNHLQILSTETRRGAE